MSTAAVTAATAFRGVLQDEQLQLLLSTHAPLAAWLRTHRKETAPMTPSNPSNGTQAADEAIDGRGDALVRIGAAAVKAYQQLLESVVLEVERAAADAAAAAAERQERLRATREKPAQSASASAAPSTVADGSYGWVRELCRMHRYANMDPSATEVTDAEVDMMAAAVLGQLYTAKSDDVLQGDLLATLGFDAIELIAQVLPQRAEVSASLRRLLAAAEHGNVEGGAGSLGGSGGGGGGGGGGGPPVGCMVMLTSQAQQKQEKQRRKDAAKQAKEKRRAALEETRSPEEIAADLHWLAAAGFEPAAEIVRKEEEAKMPTTTTDPALLALRAAATVGGMPRRLATTPRPVLTCVS